MLRLRLYWHNANLEANAEINVDVDADLFTLLDSDSDSDSKPIGYIALYRSFHTAQSRIQIPILTANYTNPSPYPSRSLAM